VRLLGASYPNQCVQRFHSKWAGSPGLLAHFTIKVQYLADLTIEMCERPSLQDSKEICQFRLIGLLKKNTKLLHLTSKSLRGQDRSILSQKAWAVCDGLWAMNKAGRQYMLTDPANKREGTNVLIAAGNSADCIALSLVENPFILCRGSAR